MIVIVANHIPDAVRGKLKLWFVEPKPNVFVSGIRDSLADDIVDLMMKHCPPSSGLLIFKETRTPPFFQMYSKGLLDRNISLISGMQLIVERIQEINPPPHQENNS